MTKPTIEQVEQCSDVNQLHEWSAVYCLELQQCENLGRIAYCHPKGRLYDDHGLIQPCKPTPIGKAQCFDFIVKYRMEISIDQYGFVRSICCDESKMLFNRSNLGNQALPQIAIVKAAIISAVSE